MSDSAPRLYISSIVHIVYIFYCFSFFFYSFFITVTEKAVTASANALRLNDTTHWGWGQLENGTSRVLAIHANCIYFVKETNHTVAAAPRLSKKERWLRSINSWFI